jgi:hypothetical protein
MFPTVKFIAANKYGTNIFNVIGHFKDEGYTKFVGLFGSDRATTFNKMFTNAEESLKQKLIEEATAASAARVSYSCIRTTTTATTNSYRYSKYR